MKFHITIDGASLNPDMEETELHLRRFIGEVRQAAMNHNLNLQIPVVVTIPQKETVVTDGFNCLIQGGTGNDRPTITC